MRKFHVLSLALVVSSSFAIHVPNVQSIGSLKFRQFVPLTQADITAAIQQHKAKRFNLGTFCVHSNYYNSQNKRIAHISIEGYPGKGYVMLGQGKFAKSVIRYIPIVNRQVRFVRPDTAYIVKLNGGDKAASCQSSSEGLAIKIKASELAKAKLGSYLLKLSMKTWT